MEYKKGQLIDALISDTGDGDKAFAKLDDGISLFVRGPVAPGDRVRVELYKIKKRMLEGRFRELLEASPDRIEAPCKHFGVCGGCKWQHIRYEEQLRFKVKVLTDAMQRLGGFEEVPMKAVTPAPHPYRYRNKVDFSFSDSRFILQDEPSPPVIAADFALGFHAPGVWQKALHIDACHLVPEPMNEILTQVRSFALENKLTPFSPHTLEGLLRSLIIRHAVRTNQWMVNMVTSWYDETAMKGLAAALKENCSVPLTTLVNNISTRSNSSTLGEEEFIVDGPGYIEEVVGGCRFRISANSFFQTNTLQAEALYDKVLERAGLKSGMTAYDLYCGTGSISLLAARTGARVFGFESIPEAIADAEKNAELNGIDSCTFKVFDLNKTHKNLEEFLSYGKPDVIITDPPRAGMHPRTVDAVRQLAPARIVYVSCKPASLARDASMLCQDGLYKLIDVEPVDLFPQTQHIESVALLEKAP